MSETIDADGESWTDDLTTGKQFARITRAVRGLPAAMLLAVWAVCSMALTIVFSPHAVLAGPYHRAEQAILDTIRAFNGTQLMARAMVKRHAIDYIALCPTSDEVRLTAAEAPDGFLSRLMRGQKFRWLEPIARPAASPLMIFRVKRSDDG